MKKMRKYQEGGMTDEDLEKYRARPDEGTSGSFLLPSSGSRRSVRVSSDGMSAGMGPTKPQSSGMINRNESMVGKVAKTMTPGGSGPGSAVAAAAEARRKKEQGYKNGGYVRAADGCAQRGKTKGTMVVMK